MVEEGLLLIPVTIGVIRPIPVGVGSGPGRKSRLKRGHAMLSISCSPCALGVAWKCSSI